MANWNSYKHGIYTFNTTPTGDSGLAINNNFVTIGNLFDTALAKQNAITTGSTSQYLRGDLSLATLNATAVGLGNVVNTDTTTTSNISDSTNKRFVTDAELVVIGNTSGNNTGDQNLSGYAITAGTLAEFSATTSSQLAGVISDETGSGFLVFATSPTLTTPNIGVATATSVNNVTITAPASSAILTIANGKTATISNTLTFSGTDSSTLNIGAGGTLGSLAFLSTATPATGGTGLGTLTAHAVILGAGTSNVTFATIGTAGKVLTDNGGSADPSFKTPSQQARITFDGGGSAITGTPVVWFTCQFAGTITGYTLLADQSGSIVINVGKATYSGFPTFSSIDASAPPTLSSAQKATDTTLTGWTTSVNVGDIIQFQIGSVSTVTHVQLFLNIVGT